MASLGAASLVPNRVTPAPKRPPRVRSDERPIATQGDVLNSIKFQRRCRETLYAEKAGIPDRNSSLSKKPPATIRTISSGTGNLNKQSTPRPQAAVQVSTTSNKESINRNKPITVMRSFFSPQRPMSPKGRRNTQTTTYL